MTSIASAIPEAPQAPKLDALKPEAIKPKTEAAVSATDSESTSSTTQSASTDKFGPAVKLDLSPQAQTLLAENASKLSGGSQTPESTVGLSAQ